jgi:putative Holliday junction resolvase
MIGRILALDLGQRRIGLAISDELGFSAHGLPTWERKNRRLDLEALDSIVREKQVRLILVGNPLHLSGDESAQSRRAAEFASIIAKDLGVQVKLWDERLTTREASRVLRESGMSIRKRGQAVDRLSAVLILQNYLDYLAAQGEREAPVAP